VSRVDGAGGREGSGDGDGDDSSVSRLLRR
jgi:hypothetical protein